MRDKLGPIDRTVATVLGLIWLSGGVTSIVLGLARASWLPVLFGPFALWYAVAWLRVARRNRLLTWSELATPWRRGRP